MGLQAQRGSCQWPRVDPLKGDCLTKSICRSEPRRRSQSTAPAGPMMERTVAFAALVAGATFVRMKTGPQGSGCQGKMGQHRPFHSCEPVSLPATGRRPRFRGWERPGELVSRALCRPLPDTGLRGAAPRVPSRPSLAAGEWPPLPSQTVSPTRPPTLLPPSVPVKRHKGSWSRKGKLQDPVSCLGGSKQLPRLPSSGPDPLLKTAHLLHGEQSSWGPWPWILSLAPRTR